MFGCDQRVKITCCKDAITETHARGRESKRQRKEAANNVAAIHLIYTGKIVLSLQTGITWYHLTLYFDPIIMECVGFLQG